MLWKLSNVAILLGTAGFWLLIAAQVMTSSNHVGFHIEYAMWLFAACAAWAGYAAAAKKLPNSTMATVASVAALLSILMLIMLDHFNILMQYERWIDKGMPPKPF